MSNSTCTHETSWKYNKPYTLLFLEEEDLFSHEKKLTKNTINKTMYKRQSKEKTIE